MGRLSRHAVAFCVSLAVVQAAPVAADEAFSQAERETFIATVTANGCQITEAEAPILFPAVGIDKETSYAIVEALISEGLAVRVEAKKSLVLKTEGCAP